MPFLSSGFQSLAYDASFVFMLYFASIDVQDRHVAMSFRSVHFILSSFFSCLFRSAYRAEVATFVVPVAGESASDTRLRERIDFTSNILFFIEDLYLALGPGHVTTKTGAKINVASSLLWVRCQLAGSVKELMIAKKSGWQVLRNLKNEVILFFSIFYFIYLLYRFSDLSLFRHPHFSKPFEAFEFL